MDHFGYLHEVEPDYWATLREHPLTLHGLTYPEPTPALPPATGPIVLGELVGKAVSAKPRRGPKAVQG